MNRSRTFRARRAATVLLVSGALLAAACGSGSESAVETGDRPDIAPSAEGASAPLLPPVTVWDVKESDWVQFADYLPAEKPLLVWFWAPHCPACAAEAPAMVEFAAEHGDDIDIVGLGTQDDAGLAADFVDRHDIPFPMLWDETFETWRAFGVTAQPAVYLLSGQGEVLGGWLGGLPEQEVLALTA
ncbi:MAG: TlpA family protein disulfide reductase [Microthrixaceae bacterium]